MAKTYKGWTRINRDDTYKDSSRYFTKWVREGYPTITDFQDGMGKGWCPDYTRYEVSPVKGQPYVRSECRQFEKLSDAILYAETGKYSWQV